MSDLTKRQIKKKKREISENTALYVGFSISVLNQLPEYAIFEAFRSIQNIGKTFDNDADLRNAIITESVRAMNYQDFKQIENYFF